MGAVSAVVDEVLEGSVVGSFSRVGYEVRRRLGDWSEPAAMPGRSVMVTGATSGLGFEAALRFARLGAAVTFVGRDQGRCEEARRSIAERSGSDRVEFLVADMADLDSIRSAAAAYCDQIATLDVLVHNAGMLTREYQQAPDCGVELTAAVHVLGPFLLTGLLLPALRRAAAETTHPARVLTVSSGGMYLQRFDLNRFDAGPTGFDGPGAYARAKRAQVVLGHAWADRIDPREVVFQTMHPGWADTPGVRSSLPGFYRLARPILRTPAQGVDTLVWLSQAPEAEVRSGDFWLDRRARVEHRWPGTRPSDPAEERARLWQWCSERSGWSLPA